MISFADRRLRGEEWHWAGIVLLVRGDVTDPWHTDRCWFAAPPFDSIATALRALNGERRENAGAVGMSRSGSEETRCRLMKGPVNIARELALRLEQPGLLKNTIPFKV